MHFSNTGPAQDMDLLPLLQESLSPPVGCSLQAGDVTQWQSSSPACTRPWVPSPAPKQQQSKSCNNHLGLQRCAHPVESLP